MKILISPNAFKRSLNALQIAQFLKEGILSTAPGCSITLAPIADGGDGTTDILLQNLGGSRYECLTKNALLQDKVANFGILPDQKTAIIGLASASGIAHIPLSERNPERATTYGTGILIKKALDLGCTNILLGLGGSASTDVGTGILSALGIQFLDAEGKNRGTEGGGSFHHITHIDTSKLDPRISQCHIKILCDVQNPLLGFNGSVYTFGHQKGLISKEQKAKMEANVKHIHALTLQHTGKDMNKLAGAGAAGGTSAGLWAFLGAELVPGTDYIIDLIKLKDRISQADIIITAEGRFDQQSLHGKAPYQIAQIAKQFGKKVICIPAQYPDYQDQSFNEVFDLIWPLPTHPMSLESSIQQSQQLLFFAGQQLGKILRLTSPI